LALGHHADELGGLLRAADRVAGDDEAPRLGKQCRGFLRQALDPGTAGGEGAGVLATRASRRHLGLIAAVMALQPRRIAMLDQPGGALRALHAMPTIAAQGQRRVAAAIEKE